MRTYTVIFLFVFGTHSTHATEVEKCFIYPVNDTNPSPWFEIEESSMYQVTINTIVEKGNRLDFLNENNELVKSLDLDDYLVYDIFNKRDVDIFFHRGNNSMAIYIKDIHKSKITMPENPQKLKIKSQHQIYVTFDCPAGCKKFEAAVIHTKLTTNPLIVRIYGKIKDLSDYESKIAVKHDSLTEIINLEENFNLQLNKTFGTIWFFFDIYVSFEMIHSSHQHDIHIEVTSLTLYTKAPSQKIVNYLKFGSSSFILVLDFSSTTNIQWAYNCMPEESSTGATKGGVPVSHSNLATSVLGILLLITLFGIVICKGRGYLNTPPCPVGETGRRDSQEENEYAYMDLQVLQRQLEKERLERENDQQIPEVMAQEAGVVGDGGSNHSTINSIYEGFDDDAGSGNVEGNDEESSARVSINSIYERFDGASNATDVNSQNISKKSTVAVEDNASNIAGTNSSERKRHEIAGACDDIGCASNVSASSNH